LTRGKDPVDSGLFSPDGHDVVFCKDADGNETYHMYLVPVDGRRPRRITSTPRRMWGSFDWNPNGKEITRSIAMKKSCGLETVDLLTGECFMLKEPTPPIGAVQYSHDGKYIACDATTSPEGEEVLVFKRDDPSDVIAYSVRKGSQDNSPCFSPDARRLAFASDANGARQIVIQEFQGASREFIDLARGEEVLGSPIWGPKADRVFYITGRHSRTVVREHEMGHKTGRNLSFPAGTVESVKICPDGSVTALHSSMVSPPAIYMLKRRSKSAVSLTPQNYGIDASRLMRPESAWYKSFDGRKIHAWYMGAASRSSSSAAVVWVHGGPTWQVFDCWHSAKDLHCLSLSGFAVIAPNFRGSTGYGPEFRRLNIGDLGGGDLKDVIGAGEWLRKRKGIPAARIAVGGGSYGGYMTLMALTARPSAFAAGVSTVPVTDWLAFNRLSDAAFISFFEELWGGRLSGKEELLRSRSPITHVSKIRAPVLIKGGKTDARCPIQPIIAFVKKLKEIGHPHEFILEEKEGHLSVAYDYRAYAREVRSMISFLQRNLT